MVDGVPNTSVFRSSALAERSRYSLGEARRGRPTSMLVVAAVVGAVLSVVLAFLLVVSPVSLGCRRPSSNVTHHYGSGVLTKNSQHFASSQSAAALKRCPSRLIDMISP